MLKVENLNVQKLNGTMLIENASFTINDEDKAAIIGEEGNGKSTLLKILCGNIDPFEDSFVTFNGRIESTYQKIGYLPQHLPDEWKDNSPSEYLLKTTPSSIIAPEDWNKLELFRKSMESMLMDVSLIERETPMEKLSGGEKVKLQLLKLVNTHNDILLLDEPTNDLDINTLEFLESFILNSKIPIIFVSHDELLLEKCSNKILHLEQVNMKTKRVFTEFTGTYRDYAEKRLKGFEKAMTLARKEKAEYLEKKRKLNDIMNAVHHAQNVISRKDPAGGRLLKKKMHTVKAMERRFEKESYSTVDHPEEAINVFFPDVKLNPSKIILQKNDMKISIGKRLLIDTFPLDIKARDKVVIIGDNGTGKTLLLNEIYNLVKDRSDLNIGYMPQDYMKELNNYNTALEFLSEKGNKEDITRGRELMGAMKFTREEMENNPSELSDGQKAKLFILRFIKDGKNILILDEPTRNFSPLSAPVIRYILKSFSGCIISVSHDRLYIGSVCKKVLKVSNQSILSN